MGSKLVVRGVPLLVGSALGWCVVEGATAHATSCGGTSWHEHKYEFVETRVIPGRTLPDNPTRFDDSIRLHSVGVNNVILYEHDGESVVFVHVEEED